MFVSLFLCSVTTVDSFVPLPFHKGSVSNRLHPYFAGISNCLKLTPFWREIGPQMSVLRNTEVPPWPLVTRVMGGLDGDTGTSVQSGLLLLQPETPESTKSTLNAPRG